MKRHARLAESLDQLEATYRKLACERIYGKNTWNLDHDVQRLRRRCHEIMASEETGVFPDVETTFWELPEYGLPKGLER